MAHTSSTCYPSPEYHLVPTDAWDEENVRAFVPQRHARRVRLNFHYREDSRSWKRTTKASRQFARHG